MGLEGRHITAAKNKDMQIRLAKSVCKPVFVCKIPKIKQTRSTCFFWNSRAVLSMFDIIRTVWL